MADNKKNNSIVFTGDNGENIEFEVIEQTTISGNNYLLVCTTDDGEESDAFILKEISKSGDDVVYDEVIDDIEFTAVAKVFDELLDEGFDMHMN